MGAITPMTPSVMTSQTPVGIIGASKTLNMR